MATNHEDKERLIRSMIGEIISLGNPGNAMPFIDRGYSVSMGEYGSYKVSKYGIAFTVYIDCNYKPYPSGIAYYKDKIYNINKKIGVSALADDMGDDIPEYKRTDEFSALIDTIKTKVDEVSGWFKSCQRLSLLGAFLQRKGCFVSYDGYSSCSFEKDGICYGAHNDYPNGWILEDRICVYKEDGTLSEWLNFADIDKVAEKCLYGMTKIGRRLTEKDRINRYTRFRVRTYASKTIKTIKWFDNFEDAKKYAYELAKEKYDNLPGDLKRYGYANPKDVSDELDLLCGYLWYKAGEGSEHYVYVCGEEE